MSIIAFGLKPSAAVEPKVRGRRIKSILIGSKPQGLKHFSKSWDFIGPLTVPHFFTNALPPTALAKASAHFWYNINEHLLGLRRLTLLHRTPLRALLFGVFRAHLLGCACCLNNGFLGKMGGSLAH